MSTVKMNTKAIDEWFDLTIGHSVLSEAALGLTTYSGNDITIDWGDGIIEDVSSSSSTVQHTFQNPSITLRIKTALGLEDISSFRAFTLNIFDSLDSFAELVAVNELYVYSPNVFGNIAVLSSLIERFYCKFPISGNISDLPNGIEVFWVQNSGANIVGDLADLPSEMVVFEISNSNLTGSINNLPIGLENFSLSNNTNNITGIIGNLPLTLIRFRVVSPNLISGGIATLPNILSTFEVLGGDNIISGLLDDLPPNVAILQVTGNNKIEGTINNLSNTLKYLIVTGDNEISGDVANLDDRFVNVTIDGVNTISGNIEDAKVQYLTIRGNNSISGNLGARTNSQTKQTVSIGGNNTIQNFNSKDYSGLTNINIILIDANPLLTTAQVDQLLNDLAIPGLTAIVRLYTASRTSASDAAVTTILANGGEVTFTA